MGVKSWIDTYERERERERERESSTCNERKSFDINNKKVKCYLK